MQQPAKKNSNIFLKVIKIGLVVYTAVRSIDLVMSTLPEGVKIFGVAIIFGLDLALLAWDDYSADPYKASSDGQHIVGTIMIVLNMLGIGAAMVADSARIVDPVGSADLIYNVSILLIPAAVLCNIAGTIAVKQLDPDRIEEMARANHMRMLIRMQNDAERRLELDEAQTQVGITEFRNRSKLKQARQKYYIDDDGDGVPDRVYDGESARIVTAKDMDNWRQRRVRPTAAAPMVTMHNDQSTSFIDRVKNAAAVLTATEPVVARGSDGDDPAPKV